MVVNVLGTFSVDNSDYVKMFYFPEGCHETKQFGLMAHGLYYNYIIYFGCSYMKKERPPIGCTAGRNYQISTSFKPEDSAKQEFLEEAELVRQ